ncbi:hypothetical protein RUM43_006072 [Polyplax serrata]|uniref:Uncharacterized protein n=1 Tax=Polyplax serrata TaxID=468196 RepID=A0AAN8NSI1_POLSC
MITDRKEKERERERDRDRDRGERMDVSIEQEKDDPTTVDESQVNESKSGNCCSDSKKKMAGHVGKGWVGMRGGVCVHEGRR